MKPLNRDLLNYLQQACNVMTEGYKEQIGNSRIEYRVLQFSDIACPKCRYCETVSSTL